jgi:dihydrolipoamide dehydrogenase
MSDVVVVGGGIAGERVAIDVARGGKSAALIEAGLVGGQSPYLACIPSNSLLRSARAGEPWEHAVARRDALTAGLDDSAAASRLAAAGVTLVRGTGRVTAPGTVTVAPAAGGDDTELSYADLVIATGGEPLAPPIEGFADIQPWTTAEALTCLDLPRRLVILGGGPAGCELAQIYAAFGTQVTLAEAADRLLPAEPAFAGQILAGVLRRAGVELRLGSPATKAERVGESGEGLALALADGTRLEADRLLLASGRRPRLAGLGLDLLGIDVTPGKPLPADTACRVADRVWAAGDATGTGSTHAARYQAGIVAANILGEPRVADYRALPRAVYTDPSVFAVGATPEAAADAGMKLATAGAALAGTARAGLDYVNCVESADAGYVELYADPVSGMLVGAAAVGPDAADWMAEITLAIRARIPVSTLADVVHAFPTHGEVLQIPLGVLAGITGKAETTTVGGRAVSEMDIETPDEDAAEQARSVPPEEEAEEPRELPIEVNEADAAEQTRDVPYDDDDYR